MSKIFADQSHFNENGHHSFLKEYLEFLMLFIQCYSFPPVRWGFMWQTWSWFHKPSTKALLVNPGIPGEEETLLRSIWDLANSLNHLST